MVAVVQAFSLFGVRARPVQVEVQIGNGLPVLHLVGLPDSAVREAHQRVRLAIEESGFQFPASRLTVNLAPADVPKVGSAFDLPMAVAVLAASGQLARERLAGVGMVGELALDGALRPVAGCLPVAMAARRLGLRELVLPKANAAEAARVEGVGVRGCRCLSEVVEGIGTGRWPRDDLRRPPALDPRTAPSECVGRGAAGGIADLAQVRGQAAARRALEIAIAGGHNLLLVGSPGSGKTLLARCAEGILPELDDGAALEVAQVYSAAGLPLPPWGRPPFRAPHHTSSTAALAGGGRLPRPGEISLAHRGVLFLDELPEFRRDAIEALRQPLEAGEITVHRGGEHVSLPARIILIAAMNPCPCGLALDGDDCCRCAPAAVRRYRSKVSGPLLDRFDLHLEVSRPTAGEMWSADSRETSEAVRRRVAEARIRQRARWAEHGWLSNAEVAGPALTELCGLDGEARAALRQAYDRLRLSVRALDRLARVGRTIADLEESDAVQARHVLEALGYRMLGDWWRQAEELRPTAEGDASGASP